MACALANISFTQVPQIVFAVGTVDRFEKFPVEVISGCIPPTVPVCSIVTSNPSFITTGTTVSILTTTTPGDYTGSITCIETKDSQEITTKKDFSFFIVNPNQFTFTENSAVEIPDCTPTKITTHSLNFTNNGFVTPNMIVITPFVSNDTLFSTNPQSLLGPNSFTQQDVEDGFVYVNPTILTNVGSSRSSSIMISGVGPEKQELTGLSNYIIKYTYCPLVELQTVPITSYGLNPVYLENSVFKVYEPHGLSLWDTEWILPPIANGRFEWYCPDTSCGGSGWKPFTETSTFKYSWVIMNSLRWTPASTFQISFTISTKHAYVGGVPLSVTFTPNFSENIPTNYVAPPPPYLETSSQTCQSAVLTAKSVSYTTSADFGPFISSSPIRPVCFSVASNQASTSIGDFQIATEVAAIVKVSGYVTIGSDVEFPLGFQLLSFTGTKSTIGQLHQAIRVETDVATSIVLTLPQVVYPPQPLIKSVNDISVLQYNPLNGRLSFTQASSWVQDSTSAPILSITVHLPNAGFYIFGYMDFINGGPLPIFSNSWITYLTFYGNAKYHLSGADFLMSFSSETDTKVATLRPSRVVWNPDGYEIKHSYYVTADNPKNAKMILKHKVSAKNHIWG
ncbi:hypothetical protein BC833DRAFT_594492 [Globomyces pollinis-pini]|nr:hypothetical protein BC833DRAFT_594492 [Globomyces pollinis-pini]